MVAEGQVVLVVQVKASAVVLGGKDHRPVKLAVKVYLDPGGIVRMIHRHQIGEDDSVAGEFKFTAIIDM